MKYSVIYQLNGTAIVYVAAYVEDGGDPVLVGKTNTGKKLEGNEVSTFNVEFAERIGARLLYVALRSKVAEPEWLSDEETGRGSEEYELFWQMEQHVGKDDSPSEKRVEETTC